MLQSASRGGVCLVGGCLPGPGGSAWSRGVSAWSQGGSAWSGGWGCLPGPGGVCLVHGGVCLVWRGVCLVWGGVCLVPGGSAWSGGVCLVQGGSGIPACTEADTLPPCGQTHTSKNITLATTSLRPVKREPIIELLVFRLWSRLVFKNTDWWFVKPLINQIVLVCMSGSYSKTKFCVVT